MQYKFSPDNFEYDECTAKGSCSIPPSIAAIQEVILICLKQLAFYILKIQDFGETCFNEKEFVIQILSTTISTTDYSDKQHLNVVSEIYLHLANSREKYIKLCKEKNITCKELKSELNITPQMTLSQIISLGEKAFLNKYKKIKPLQKKHDRNSTCRNKEYCS